jgi:hypothetical protein
MRVDLSIFRLALADRLSHSLSEARGMLQESTMTGKPILLSNETSDVDFVCTLDFALHRVDNLCNKTAP